MNISKEQLDAVNCLRNQGVTLQALIHKGPYHTNPNMNQPKDVFKTIEQMTSEQIALAWTLDKAL